jgi:hypothetical protein
MEGLVGKRKACRPIRGAGPALAHEDADGAKHQLKGCKAPCLWRVAAVPAGLGQVLITVSIFLISMHLSVDTSQYLTVVTTLLTMMVHQPELIKQGASMDGETGFLGGLGPCRLEG